jgi:hypothetical protein
MSIFLILFSLGLYHGVNPAMGWLLAFAVGYKKKSRWALVLSVLSLTIGHLLSVALVLLAFIKLQEVISFTILGWIVSFLLIAIGVFHLWKKKHPNWFGMDVGYFTIGLWSFLIASAHGAGVMLLPFVMGEQNMIILVLTHTAGYFVATATCSFLLFETTNLAALKKYWINFELLWSCSLILTGLFFIAFYLI